MKCTILASIAQFFLQGGFSSRDVPNKRKSLYNHWARFGAAFKLQPLDYVRYYVDMQNELLHMATSHEMPCKNS